MPVLAICERASPMGGTWSPPRAGAWRAMDSSTWRQVCPGRQPCRPAAALAVETMPWSSMSLPSPMRALR
jgi:hypothetical protein